MRARQLEGRNTIVAFACYGGERGGYRAACEFQRANLNRGLDGYYQAYFTSRDLSGERAIEELKAADHVVARWGSLAGVLKEKLDWRAAAKDSRRQGQRQLPHRQVNNIG